MEKDDAPRERIPTGSSSSSQSRGSNANTFIATVPRYRVDLDLPPDERWNQIVDDYKRA
jgi:hypothetical protein